MVVTEPNAGRIVIRGIMPVGGHVLLRFLSRLVQRELCWGTQVGVEKRIFIVREFPTKLD